MTQPSQSELETPIGAGAPDVVTAPVPSTQPGRVGRPWRHASRLMTAVRRLAYALVTLVVISTVTFVAGNYRDPVDVARSALPREATPQQLQAYVDEHGLADPIVLRYVRWMADFVRGDWGHSAVTNRPVLDDVLPRFQHTVVLTVLTLLIATPLSVAAGLAMARARSRWRRMAMSVTAVSVASVPEFVVGAVLLLVFSVQLGWLPVISTAVNGGSPREQALAYVLPTATLVLAVLPHVSRITDSAARDTLGSAYVQAATLRGVSPRRIVNNYALRNASVPIVNAIGINAVYLLSGVIVVENVFAFPGIGQQLVQAINAGDAVTIQSITVLMAAFFIATGMVVDAVAVYLNPRLKGA